MCNTWRNSKKEARNFLLCDMETYISMSVLGDMNDSRWHEVLILLWCYEVSIWCYEVSLVSLIILTVSELQLIEATYVREYISENFFSVFFCYYQYAEKSLIMLIWPFTKVNDRDFALFAKVYVLKMPKFWDFLNLRNFLLAKVSDLKVFQESFQLQFQDYVIL